VANSVSRGGRKEGGGALYRRNLAVLRWLAAAALAAACGVASGQAYPSKPIRLLVPFAPGGIGDLTARVVAQKLSENTGQQVLIDNRPSAGMIVTAEAALKAAPDGYTLVLTGNGTAVSASLFKSLPYNVLTDFVQVSTLGFFDMVVLASVNSKFHSIADVVAFARANPGKLDIGTISIGSTQNLAAELFKSMAGIDAQIVPFKATPALITALRGSDVQVVFEFLAPVLPQVRNNSVRALAVTPERRYAGLPGTPTVAESGVPGYQVTSWNGVSVHARTPRPIVERLNNEVVAAVNSPEVKKKLEQLGVEARSTTPEQMRELMSSEIAKWRAVIERAGIERR